MPTVIEVLEGAYGTSKKNQPAELADEAVELTQVVYRALSGMYAVAARFNPYYFGVATSVAFPGAGSAWVFPADAFAVPLIEKADGTEVDIVPIRERASADLPAVYHLGRGVYAAGADPDDTTDALTIYHSAPPVEPADENATIDPTWPQMFDDLLVHEVGVYLALKDNRPEEIQGLIAKRDSWLALFVSHVQSVVPFETRAFSNIQLFNDPRLVPLSALLAGGTNLQL